MVDYTLSADTAAKTVSLLYFVPKNDRATTALVALFGAQALVDLYEDPGSEAHDGAWNCFGLLENHVFS